MDIVIATNNPGKLEQFYYLLKPLKDKYKINLLSLKDINYNNDIEETGTTFEENSLIKATAIVNETGYNAIGEDSGVCIDALNGEPGLYTARFAQGLSKQQKLEKVLDMLKDVPDEKRGATFVSVVTAKFTDGTTFVARYDLRGKITKEIVNLNMGMAFTPVFKADDCDKIMSELTFEELLQTSHRARSTQNLLAQITPYLDKKLNKNE